MDLATSTRTAAADRRAAFRTLHRSGCFVLPNPWDVGSARLLHHLGFQALATTSSGHAWSRGRADGDLPRAATIAHLREMAAATDLPLNADFAGGFADAGYDDATTLPRSTRVPQDDPDLDPTRANPIGAAETTQGPEPTAQRPLTHASGAVDETAVAFSVFSNLLASDGLRAALYSLLRRTDYRFIAVFRFLDGHATSAVYVDRENLSELQAAEVPDTATYCCFVRDANGIFVTADAMVDPRALGHPAQSVVRAYCGIPILEPEGALVGTLCHYNLQPRDPEQLDLELLLQVASALARPGVVPPYPQRPSTVQSPGR